MNPLIERLGWTLLHSLWQGILAWAALRIALSLLRQHSARARYLAACGALMLATIAPWITFFQLDVTDRISGSVPPSASSPTLRGVTLPAPAKQPASAVDASLKPPAVSPSATSSTRHVVSDRFGTVVQPALPWLVGFWSVGFAVSCLRLLRDWRQTRALVRGPLTSPSAELAARFASLLARMRLRRTVRLGLSAWVQGPAVVGWLRPVVLLPVEALAGLTPGQIDALLIHELAHIHRADFLVNLLQAVTEALFFYHPAVHAINRLIREEREHACDDLAVTLTGDPVGYARALASLATAHTPDLTLAAAGSGGTGGLLDRVRRLLGHTPSRPRPLVTLALAALAGAVLYLVAMLGLPALTARMLTPAERIAVVKQATAAVASQSTPEFAADARMTVVCEVRTEDGSPLPMDLHISTLTQNPHRSVSSDMPVANGRGHQSVPAGEYYLLLYAPGWAPTFAGPFQPTHADEELVIPPLILRRGFPLRLRITDENARPLAGVRLHETSLRSASPAVSRNLNHPWPDLVTDVNGEVVFANVGPDTELEVTVEQPGFQKNLRVFNGFRPDTVLVFPLTPSRPTPGQVIDADTGRPIPGAQILLAGHQRPETNWGHSLKDAVQLATTDEDGRFILDTLNERWTTYVYVTAPGYAPTSVETTVAAPLLVRLDHGIRIAGRVRAAAGQLPSPTLITADYSLRTGPNSSYGHRLEQSLDLTSPEPTFAFERLPRSSDSISIVVAGRSLSLPGDTDQPDLLIDLTATTSDNPRTAALAELPKRKVVLTLHPPSGEPIPEGELELDYQKNGLNHADGSLWPRPRFPIAKGRVELTLPTPNRLELTQARLPGYAPTTRFFDIPDGSGPLLLDVSVVPAGAIHGRLTDAQGTPISGWFLSCLPDDPAESRPVLNWDNVFWGGQKTNVAGGFVTTGLPFDHGYFIVAHNDFFYATSDSIRLTRRDPIHAIEWPVPSPIAYSGRLVDPDGVPIPQASLQLSFHARHDHSFGNSTRIVTEADGKFDIPRINPAEMERYELQLVSQKNWQSFSVRLPRDLSAKSRTFTLAPGHKLSGRILDAATGRPLAGIEVSAYPYYEDVKDSPRQLLLPILAENKTDADGRFQFSTFPPGKFRISTQQGGVDSPVVTLPAQAGTDLDLHLKPWPHASGK